MSPQSHARRIGRLRALAVLAAMAISMVAGTTVPAFADAAPPARANGPSEDAPGLLKAVEARGNAAHAPWSRFAEDEEAPGSVTTAGWSWF